MLAGVRPGTATARHEVFGPFAAVISVPDAARAMEVANDTPYGLNAGVFTREYYESCRDRLQTNGLMVQWVQVYETNDETFSLVLRTFTSVFPFMSIWRPSASDLALVGYVADNVEDLMGHGGYLIFYLAVGVIASATHVVMNKLSTNPLIGASGAIAGVLGAYTVLFPRARILSLIPLGLFTRFIAIPAFLFLPLWFVMQFVYGLASLAGGGGGVAWWAHVGGFIAGIVLVPVFVRRR